MILRSLSMSEAAEPQWFDFDEFHLDLRVRVLWRGSRIVPLPPKALDTLIALLRQAGDVVLREDLIARTWPDTVVEETGLAHNIWVLRKMLGPAGESIVTVPKRGYRFTGHVRSRAGAHEQQADAAIVDQRDGAGGEHVREPVPVVLAWCPSCERHVWAATMDEALEATGASAAVLRRVIDRGTAHYTQRAPGRESLCMPSVIQA